MSSPTPVNWFNIHPKVKALALAVAVLILASLAGSLNGTVSWKETLTADVTAAISLLITYLKSSGPAVT
jgi:hypothetical protein